MVLVVIGIVGVIGYKVTRNDVATPSTPIVSKAEPQTISSPADIEQASRALDTATDDLNPDQLDSDLNALL